MSPPSCLDCKSAACRAAAHHQKSLGPGRRGLVQLDFPAGQTVDQTAHGLVKEGACQAALVAGYAGLNQVVLSGEDLVGKGRFRDQRSSHGGNVAPTQGKGGLRDHRISHAVCHGNGDIHRLADLPGQVNQACRGHFPGELGNSGLMPAAGQVDHVDARLGQQFGKGQAVRARRRIRG